MRIFHYFIYVIILQFFYLQGISFCDYNINASNSQSNSLLHNQPLLHSPREIIVRLSPNSTFTQLNKFCKSIGAEIVTPIFSPDTPAGKNPTLSRIYQITLPVGILSEQLKHQFLEHTFIEDIEMNRLRRFCSEITPNDARFSEQWNLAAMNMSKAWQLEKGKPSVVVAVVDSGIQVDHPDIENQLWHNVQEIPSNGIDDDNNGYVDDIIGWDFSDAPTLQGHGDWTLRDNQPNDETGHGTQVSGIIAAETDNRIGIAGIAPNCRIMALRAGFRIGGGAFLQNDDVAAAIVYAADNGADVINLSLGDTVNAFLIRDAVEYAYNRGCLLIAAAGNSAEPFSLYPAALQNVISVAALDRDLQLGGSNFGASIQIAAPGEDILTTDLFTHESAREDGFGYKSGTSMASAHVSGVAALLFSANPSCTNSQIHHWMTHTARELTIPQLVGAGLIDAYAALNAFNEPIANIQFHQKQQDNTIEITGSAGGVGFTHYWLDYGIFETPDLWFPIILPQTEPIYNSLLHKWDTSELNEGIYTLRLSVKSENGRTVRDKTVVEILHKLPTTYNHEGSEWLIGNRYDSTIIWQTNVLTTGAVELYDNTESQTPIRIAFSDSVNTQHYINISELKLPTGEYLYKLKSQNRSGLIRTDDNDGQFFKIKISDKQINATHLSKIISADQELQVLASPFDMNGNGKLELIALEKNTKTLNIYEFNEIGNLNRIETIDQPISLLWAIEDIDGDGLIEILGSESENTFLIEQTDPGKLSTHLIWKADGIWGGTIADTDLDGVYEIISRHDATNSIWIYEATGNDSYANVAILNNPTQGKNNLLTRFAIADFDADGKIEILAGDNDTELFIYENNGDNLYQYTWTGKLSNGIPSLFASGDLNDDTTPEFVVGAKVWASEFDLPRQHWNIAIFTTDGDNSYHLEWNQRIRELRDGINGISIADANNDGMNELCISVSPNFYLIQHNGTSYNTVWHHPSTSTFNPIVTDIDNDDNNELMFNTPNGFSIFNNTHSNDNIITKPDSKTVVPTSTPRLVSAIHSPPNQILISFDKQMDFSTANASLYILHKFEPNDNAIQMNKEQVESEHKNKRFYVPQSAIFDRSQKRVVLTFEPNIFDEEYNYLIETLGLSDIHGGIMPDTDRTITVEFQGNIISEVIVYPNPARGDKVTFDRLPADSHIYIYDASGTQIKSLSPTEVVHSGNRCKHNWTLDGIGSGVYIYVIESESERTIGKITVLK